MAKKVPRKEKSKQAVAHDLLKLTQYWGDIPHLESRKQAIELDAEKLSRQFDVIKKATVKVPLIDPSVLCDVISYTAFQ